MPTREQYLERAQQILTILVAEAIQLGGVAKSLQDRIINRKLKELRSVVETKASSFPMPGLTASLAVSYLKVGACQELAMRFAFEYMKKFQDQQVSLVFLANPLKLADNHVVVLLGPVEVDEQLLIGTGNREAVIDSKGHQSSIVEFFHAQAANCVLVDPFLACADYANEAFLPRALSDYCTNEQISCVVAVKQYCNTLSLVENTALIGTNALKVAIEANNEKNLYYLNSIRQVLFPAESANWFYIASADRFGLVGSSGFLMALQAVFTDNDFAKNVRLSETQQEKIPVLIIEQATRLDLAETILWTNTVGARFLADTQGSLTAKLNR